ncbi:MAG: hypothetical protein WCO47_09905 [Methylococcus sp.]|jgi:hypothetical protein
MMPIFRLFLAVCLFRKGPQDVPASGLLLGLLIGLNLLVSFLLGTLEGSPLEAVLQSFVADLLLLILIALLLIQRRHPERILKTATAAFGADSLISLLAFPWLVLGAIWPDLQPVTPWLMLGFMIWGQLILANLLKIALAWPAIAALGVAFLYLVISMDLIRYLFDR